VTPPSISSPAKYADGPLLPSGSRVPIHLGSPMTFNVLGKDEGGTGVDIPAASTTWYYGSTFIGFGNPTLNFEAQGSFTYKVQIEDKFRQLATATFIFWKWETENYGAINPTAITNSGNNVFVAHRVADTNYINKYERKLTGLTTAGDIAFLAQTSAASSSTKVSSDMYIRDMAVRDGTTVYSLETNNATYTYIRTWSVANLNSVTIPGFGFASTSSFKGLSLDASAIYLTDVSSGFLRKIDINNGSYYSESRFVNNPVGVINLPLSSLLVSESGTGRILRFANDLNSDPTWSSDLVGDPGYIFRSATTQNIYVVDQTDNTIKVVASTGALLYSFGSTAVGPGRILDPHSLVAIDNDIYITDYAQDLIIRFRGDTW